jgi:hypothetical protein
MAFFSLTDIKYIPGENRNFEINSKQFNIDNKRYPIDIGSTDKGHYMMFFINVQERTQVGGYTYDDTATAKVSENASGSQNVFTGVQEIGRNFLDLVADSNTKQDEGLIRLGEGSYDGSASGNEGLTRLGEGSYNGSVSGNDKVSRYATSLKESDLLKRGNFFRTVKRTTDSIALYMPDTLAFDYNQSYSDVSVASGLGIAGAGLQAGASLMNAGKKGGDAIQKNMAPFVAEATAGFGSKFGLDKNVLFTALSAATGGALAVNPQLELIYQSPSFRNFRFQFMFYPRSRKEAEEVLSIIDMFTFHQAPEVLTSSFGRYLVPPSEFDIQFFYNGQENPNIPKVSTCVLTGISVDYAPNGFASYETLLNSPERGGTGMPVAIRMDLSFKETEIITKQFLSGEKVKYKSPFRGDEAINGLDFGNEASGELRTPEQIAASTALKDFNETGITFETTATSDTEFDLANGSWGTEDTTGIDESGSGGSIGGA